MPTLKWSLILSVRICVVDKNLLRLKNQFLPMQTTDFGTQQQLYFRFHQQIHANDEWEYTIFTCTLFRFETVKCYYNTLFMLVKLKIFANVCYKIWFHLEVNAPKQFRAEILCCIDSSVLANQINVKNQGSICNSFDWINSWMWRLFLCNHHFVLQFFKTIFFFCILMCKLLSVLNIKLMCIWRSISLTFFY